MTKEHSCQGIASPETQRGQKYALISVTDKSGVAEFASALDKLGYRLIASTGTAKVLAENDISVIPATKITGDPEAFDGRMKTISFKIQSGELFDRQNPEHLKEAKEYGVPQIEIVVCNLYPFAETVKKEGVTLKDAVENIDVGGPTMIRAAAKNFQNVLVLSDTADYPKVAKALLSDSVDYELRSRLAVKAFRMLSDYDAAIADFLSNFKD